MRADRLLLILSLLQVHGRLSSRELSRRLEVSSRTVHRDMEALCSAGIPVYAERGASGGWTLSEGYRHRIAAVTTEEISSLLLLQSSNVVKDLGWSTQVQNAFLKLLSALPVSARKGAEYARARLHVDGAGWHFSPERVPYLSVVQEAAWEQRKLLISYRSWESDEDTERVVHPLGLVAKMSVWYMVAAIEDAEEEIRTFRISRLKKVDRLNESFVRSETFDLAAFWEQSTARFKSNLPRYPAKVRIASNHWRRFSQERYVVVHHQSSLVEGERIEAEVEFHTLESACEILLKYGRHAEAVAPEQLRDAVSEECRAAASLYGSIGK
ncbi:helix-turn-helix transcriptional regulator [Cohnella terricola]|uniref:WYL domain-containing protein n=1 Tax=Cohnella terricola TaxID=1289167 RepID=A0A559JBD1_9BACL|nr:WYL domain-containing protein [Cohnella terricola]TVX97157.1 WYL domain-containing protein [Cohnella terricola]